jgi:hypothetical protein
MAASAQDAEITKQYVAYGDYIQQYAKVQISSMSGTYETPCLDCTATANVSINNMMALKDVQMTEIMQGLFGFTCPTALAMNRTYFMRVTTVSPTYGTGFTDSYFTIISKEQAKALSLSAIIFDESDSGGLIDFTPIKNIFTSISDSIVKFIDSIGLRKAFDFFVELATWILSIVGYFWDILKTLTSVFIALIQNPKAEIDIIYEWLLNGVLWIGGIFFIFFMCAEAVIIGFSLKGKDAFVNLSRWFMLHISMFTMIGSLFSFLFDKTMRSIKAIMDLISQINPIGRGT